MDPHQRLLLEAERRLTRQARQAFDRGLGGRLASPSPLAPGEVYGGAGANIQVGSAPAGEWIHLTATGAHLAGARDVLTFDTVVARSRFDSTPGAGTFVLPRTAKYMFVLWFKWAAYLYGGTVEVEVNGTVVLTYPGQSVLGQEFGPWADQFPGNAGDQVRVLVTLPDGTSATCDAYLTLGVDEPVKETTKSYRDVVIADGPIAYWRLGEASGTTAADELDTYDGTYAGSPTLGVSALISNDPNTAVTFDGTNDEVDVGDQAALEFTGTDPFTIEAWVQLDAAANVSYSHVIVHKEDYSAQSGPNYGWVLAAKTNASGDVTFTVERWNGSDPDRTAVQSAAAYSRATTYHVVGTYDGTTLTLYVDGTAVASAASSELLVATTASLEIAHRTGSSEWFDGTVDEVAIYDRALAADEVAEHHTAGTS